MGCVVAMKEFFKNTLLDTAIAQSWHTKATTTTYSKECSGKETARAFDTHRRHKMVQLSKRELIHGYKLKPR